MRRADYLSMAAQQMGAVPSPWQYARQQDFTGGENRLLTSEFVGPNQLIFATNCEITPEGVLQTRKGLLTITSTPLGDGPVLAAFRFKRESGNGYIVVQHGTSLYSATYAGQMTTGAFAEVKTGLTAGSKLRGVVWKDKLLLTNGTENPFSFDGTTCTDLAGSPPKSKLIAVYAARLWLVPVTTPNVIRSSALEDYGTWNVLDAYKVRDGDGDAITALAPVPGGMVIFKSNSVWSLYGTSRDNIYITTSPVADNVGCYGTDTLCREPQVFMGKGGFYGFDLAGVTRLTRTHDTLLNRMTDAQKQGAIACHLSKENRVLFIFPDSYNTALNLDLNYGCITSWQGLNASCLTVADAAGDMQAYIVGDLTTGYLNMICNEDTDNGEPITTQIWTAYTDCGSVRDKVFRQFRPEFAPVKNLKSTVILYYDIDYSMSGGIDTLSHTIVSPLVWDSGKWGKNMWGPIERVRDPLWIPNERGYRISYGLKAEGRIKFLGYTTKFREVGFT